MDEKVPSFFRFEDLRIYGKAVDYTQWLLSTLRDSHTESEKNLCRSFATSAMDIALNIAEGSSRNKSQFDHYLKIAKTAIRECVIYTAIAEGLGILSKADSEHSRELLMEMTRMIGALIISLQRGTRHSHDAVGTVADDIADDSSIEGDLADLEM
ncbi:MAG: four helix bundle protein [Bacteroidales bacterium]|nr:four helix bundle protein [Bacteroidales bacterium]